MNAPKPLLRDFQPRELSQALIRFRQPGYRGRQLADWLFARGAMSWSEMTNLPTKLRRDLAESYDLQALELLERLVAEDGTRKYLFRLRDDEQIESVLIPMTGYATFCLSSQVGCARDCQFCATAADGLTRQLSSGEIIEQICHMRADLETQPLQCDSQRQFNVVFMGMGEPLDNWPQVAAAIESMTDRHGFDMSVRRITVSTSGHVPGLKRMLKFAPKVGLTLSLCGVSSETRRAMMPKAGRTPLAELLALAATYARRIRRRVTLAYILVAGRTDSLREAGLLASHAKGMPFKINLIPLNHWPERGFRAPNAKRIEDFGKVLESAGLQTTLRASSGQQIAAACGQLRRRKCPPTCDERS